MASGTEKEKLLGYFLPFPLDEGSSSESRIDSDLRQPAVLLQPETVRACARALGRDLLICPHHRRT